MECEVLFLGFGPITHAFIIDLIKKGKKVIVVTNRPIEIGITAFFPSHLFQVLNWSGALKSRIECKSTYIGWRQSPQSGADGQELLNWIKSENLKTEKFHHLSSASVYTSEKQYFLESDFDFRGTEGSLNAKQNLERIVFEISLRKETKFINYRIANVYGIGLNHGFIDESIHNLTNNLPIKIYKRTNLVRDYLFVEDLVSALSLLRLQELPQQTLNISTGCGKSISEVVALFKMLKSDDFEIIQEETPENLLLRSVLSCKTLQENINWKPKLLENSLNLLI